MHLLLALTRVATATAIATATEGGANLLEGLGINLVQLLAQIVSFLLILYLLNGLVIRPILRNLEARRKRVEESLENARLADERLATVEQERQARLNEASAEAHKLHADIVAGAQAEAQRILEEVQAECEHMRRQARVDAEAERNRVLAESRRQIVALVMAATNKLVGKSLDANRHKALINDFFNELPDANMAGLAVDGVNGAPVTVTSALPLTSDEQARVKTDLSKRLGHIEEIGFNVDPGILGGLVVRVGDKMIDGSVSGKVNAMRQQLSA